MEEPRHAREGAVPDHLADELHTEPAPAELREHVDVGEVGDRDPVGERPAEPDLPCVPVEADNSVRLADEALDGLRRPAERPVRLGRQEPVHLVEVNAGRIVVELEPLGERSDHRRTLPRAWPHRTRETSAHIRRTPATMRAFLLVTLIAGGGTGWPRRARE